MEFIKGRTLEAGQEVFVYFNLHKKVFSVKDVKTGLVVAHTEKINLEEATFKVSEAGRQRVLETGVKNVHAGVRGKYITANVKFLTDRQVTYNPKKYDSFIDLKTMEPIHKASLVVLEDKKIFV